MKLSRFALIALVPPFVACSDTTPTTITQLNLDRPADIAFACHGGLRISGETDAITSAQPLESCRLRSARRTATDPAPVPAGQEGTGTANWYAFILQSGRGTVAVAQFVTKPPESFGGGGASDYKILDADPLTPGNNGISVGEDPIAIATDRPGCFEVIANAGSCDLSTLDINSAVEATIRGDDPIVKRMDVKNAAGEIIRARPAAMTFQPAGGVIGERCPAQPTGLAYIAYPSCHLVAGVDVATGTIVTGVQFDASGTPTVVTGNVTCPAECDGAATTPGIRPVALDLELDPRTGTAILAIGADNSPVITAYALDTQSFLPLSLIPQVSLENTNGRLGVTSLALTPVIGIGGENGRTTGVNDDTAPGGDHQFVYAVTNDGTVRVVDLTGAPRECDTQIDSRFLRNERDVVDLACLPIGSPTLPRRAGARGPGIELIDAAIATSVDVSRVDWLPPLPTPEMPSPPQVDIRETDRLRTIGYFALIASASGRVFVVNVDDDDYADVPGTSPRDTLATPLPTTLPHQLRDALPSRGLIAEEGTNPAVFTCNNAGPDPDVQGGNQGGPRLAGGLTRTLPAGVLAQEKTGGLPSIRQVLCDDQREGEEDRPVNELFFSAPLEVREQVFPDLRGMRADETWTFTYEGSLSNDRVDTAIDGPPVRQGQMFIDSLGLRIEDTTRPFCDAGVEPYDVVQLRGCDPAQGDAGCPIGYTCYVHPQSQVTGLGACMLANEAERLSTTCKSFLTSQRRYTVGRTKSGEIQLLPRKHVLRTTPLDGCVDDAQCEALGDYALQNASSTNPGEPNQITDTKTWRCQADPDRRPVGGTGNRCLLVCNTDDDCAFGTVCTQNAAAGPGHMGYCMEGVVPPQSCVNAPQRYELRAGEAFTVIGSRQGYMHPIIADQTTDLCVRNPNANPLLVGRVPLDPPECDPAADPVTGRRIDGSYDENPCKLTVDETEYQLNYMEGTCELAEDDESVVTRPATGLRFRNRAMQLTLVDPTYQGDLRCHGDRQGTLVNIPLVMAGFQIAFRLTAGFSPLTVTGIAPAFPVKVVRGPTESFWIIDQGDFLSTSTQQASTRGKVYRVEGAVLNKAVLFE